MSEKCEWKDGKLQACMYSKNVLTGGYEGNRRRFPYKNMVYLIEYCPFCGADIRKPEPEVIIKRSGGTWVARFDGIDYLFVGKNLWESEDSHPYLHNNNDYKNGIIEGWKPISEIEITDEIAKLRPMIIWDYIGKRNPEKAILYGISDDDFPAICYNLNSLECDSYKVPDIKLVTVSD